MPQERDRLRLFLPQAHGSLDDDVALLAQVPGNG